MTRSSKTRRAKARAKKHPFSKVVAAKTGQPQEPSTGRPELSLTDKRYLMGFAAMSLIITVIYWSMGGRNLFIFPALMCISVGARKYWAGPMRRFADNV